MQLNCDIQGSGFPILCLHGHPGSGRSMGVFCESLSSDYLTLAPDLRGYGKSKTQAEYQLEHHLDDLVELLDAYGINRCFVLGWSLGGILAMELALRCPDRVAGLILVATAARPVGNHPPTSWGEMVNTGIASLLNLALPGHPWVINTFGKRSLYRYLLQRHTSHAYQRLAQEGVWAYLNTSPQANRALNRALAQRYNRLDALTGLQCPSLVLCGEQDCHITAMASLETAEYLPLSESQCYPNTAHLLPWEVPDLVLNDIRAWLYRHARKSNPSEDWSG
jgi:pimeloyl-ACP methyl ester carboxylesterase